MVFASGQSRFLTVGNYGIDALKKAWKESCEGMEFTMNFLKSNIGIDSPALLASPFLMIVVAYFGHVREYKITPEEAALLRYWALAANAKGRFSRGSSESLLDQDLATLRDGGKVQDLIERLRLQVGRLDITPEELEVQRQDFVWLKYRQALEAKPIKPGAARPGAAKPGSAGRFTQGPGRG